nr:hypothetical protein [Tanacetum cinerariifolium]
SLEDTVRPARTRSTVFDMDDFAAIERIAEALASRRNIDPALVIPQLLRMFNADSAEEQAVECSPTALTAPWPTRVLPMVSSVNAVAPKH